MSNHVTHSGVYEYEYSSLSTNLSEFSNKSRYTIANASVLILKTTDPRNSRQFEMINAK